MVAAVSPRLPDWRVRLHAALADTPPFAWGAHDCCRFAARCVAAMTGQDPIPDYAGAYADAASAQGHVDAAGGLQALATARLGAPIAAARAMTGDLVLLDLIGGRETLGICLGDRIAAQGPDGVTYLKRARAVAAWRI